MSSVLRNNQQMDLFVSQMSFEMARRLYFSEQYSASNRAIETLLESPGDSSQAGVSVFSCWLLYVKNLIKTAAFGAARDTLEWLAVNSRTETDELDVEILVQWVNLAQGQYREVVIRANELVERAVRDWSPRVSDTLLLKAYTSVFNDKSVEAIECCQIGYSVAVLRSDLYQIAEFVNLLGILEGKRGNFNSAIHWFSKNLSISQQLESRYKTGVACLNIGISLYKLHDLRKSENFLGRALAELQACEDCVDSCRTHIALGNVHRLLESFGDARKHLTQAYTMATDLKIPREECLALEFLGDVFRDEGRPAEARRYYARGMAIAFEIAPEGDLVMELKRREGECLVLEGQVASALPVLADARRHAAKIGDRFEEGVTIRCLADAMLAVKDYAGAQRYAEEACAVLGAVEARLEHLVARIVAGNALLGLSENVDDETTPRDLLDLAWDHALIAQSLAREIEVEHWIETVKRLQSRIAKRRVEEARYAAPVVRQTGDTYGGKGVIIAESRAMKEVLQAIEAFAPYDEALLITGETGTGKEVVARRIHELSTRREGNFVAVNVTAVPTSMFEREFFGHKRGAFSGADSDGEGYAAEADGGTLFLDEIGDMAKETQAKLLRLLQDGSYTVLGNPDERRTNLRVVAATNKDLEQAVIDGRFREDLFYRLRILEINVPPLRKHTEDIVPLLEHFLSQSAGRRVTATDYFNRTSLGLLQHYPWPGNAREVSMVARRAHISLRIDGKVLVELGSGRDALVLSGPGKEAAAAAAAGTENDLQDLTRARLVLALEESGGNRTEAARLLGISRGALYRRLERFGLE